jgi:hypothetical protein
MKIVKILIKRSTGRLENIESPAEKDVQCNL